jgi:hypothetical protein
MQNIVEINNLISNNAIYQLDVANGFIVRRSDGYIVSQPQLSRNVALPLRAQLSYNGHIIISDNNKNIAHVFIPKNQNCYNYSDEHPSPPYTLILKDDGALVLYDNNKVPVWFTKFDKQILQQFSKYDDNPDMNFWKKGFYN